MNIIQEPIQVTEPLSDLLNTRTIDINEEINAAISAYNAPIQSIENHSENELRSPLREISENTIDLSEVPEQEQELKQQEGLDDGLGNINEYVARIMEKLEKQKQKTVKLGDLLENKEKSQQVNALADVFESLTTLNDENVNVDISAKENLSPVKARPSRVEKAASPVKEMPKLKLDEILHISKQNISYGTKFPGQIAEEHFEIVNKSNQDFVVKIEVDCLNEDLQDTEEYVFSVRRSHLHEYNDRHYLIMAPYSCAAFKFALKVPNMKIKEAIEGQVRISVEDVSGSYVLNLNAKVSIPKVFCPKELRIKGMDYGITNLAVKESKKQDFKIPIRNNGNVPVTLELDFYEPKNEQESDNKQLFDILAHPTVLTVPANGTAQVNIIVKPWKIPRSMRGEKIQPVRKILVGKVRDSALVYSFVFGVQIY